ncbi:MAG: single-stranded DNA-binding protein [Cyanobacteriota bacterium]|nr:single-stranded DNA-binding protein [Cyanobacteriota bacterium]
MNSCILMVEIVQAPQLRYTADKQIPISEMLVKFSNLRDDSSAVLKVVGWGNLAQEINEKYRPGDYVIIEGRLGMNLIDRQEGFKEKRAELTVQKIFKLDIPSGNSTSMEEREETPNNVLDFNSRSRTSSNTTNSEPMSPPPSEVESEPDFEPTADPENPDYDPIPF